MTELQAALGNSQMERLDEFVEQRHRLANRYDALWKTCRLQLLGGAQTVTPPFTCMLYG